MHLVWCVCLCGEPVVRNFLGNTAGIRAQLRCGKFGLCQRKGIRWHLWRTALFYVVIVLFSHNAGFEYASMILASNCVDAGGSQHNKHRRSTNQLRLLSLPVVTLFRSWCSVIKAQITFFQHNIVFITRSSRAVHFFQSQTRNRLRPLLECSARSLNVHRLCNSSLKVSRRKVGDKNVCSLWQWLAAGKTAARCARNMIWAHPLVQ